MDGDDDLDAFFDEVDEVEEEAKKETEPENEVAKEAKNDLTPTHNEANSEGCIGGDDGDKEILNPPAKKARLTSNSSGRGTVVVSKKAVA